MGKNVLERAINIVNGECNFCNHKGVLLKSMLTFKNLSYFECQYKSLR